MRHPFESASRRALLAGMALAPALSLGALVALGAACGEREASGSERLTIAVIPKGTTHEFWKSIHAGALSAAAELDVEILWKGPLREDDRDEQMKVVEDFVIRGVDGILLAPLDDTALVQPAKDAAARGIPVVIADSDLKWDGRISFVATDNTLGGELAARELGRLLEGRGDVLMLRYQEGSASTAKREAGFLDTLRAEYPEIRIVSENQRAGATTEGAYRASENLLNSFPEVDGVFCPNESAAFGMLRALQDAGRAGGVRFIGFDASEKLLEGLRAGEIDGLVIQNPFAMGDLGVRTLVGHIRGAAVRKRIDTGVTMVTAANLGQPEIAALVSPDLSILGE